MNMHPRAFLRSWKKKRPNTPATGGVDPRGSVSEAPPGRSAVPPARDPHTPHEPPELPQPPRRKLTLREKIFGQDAGWSGGSHGGNWVKNWRR